jgi:hypothetical protein
MRCRVGVSGVMVVALLALVGAVPQLAAASEPAQPSGESDEQISSPTAALTISTSAEPSAAGEAVVFEFGGSLGNFRLAAGESVVFAELEPGSYTVAEILPEGWWFGGATCLGVEPQVVPADASVTVTLQQGQPAACTLHNYQEQVRGPAGSLTIVEQTTPSGGGSFSFDAGPLGTFALGDGQSAVFSELAAGVYAVAQDDPGGGWILQRVECAGDHQVVGSSVVVDLAEGEAVACVFYNDEALPHTGPQPFMAPLLIGGLWAVLVGLALLAWSWVRREEEEPAGCRRGPGAR